MSETYRLLLGILSVWRITHLLQAEDGPWDLVVSLRRAAGAGFFGKLMDCFYCLSMWIAAPLAAVLGQTWMEKLLLWPALSGAAILLERVTAPPTYFHEAEHEEEKEAEKCPAVEKVAARLP